MPDTDRYRADEPRMRALTAQLQDEPTHGPTAAKYPDERARDTAVGPVRPEYQQADRHGGYDAGRITLAASTAFQTVITFAGSADEIDLRTSAAGVEWRLRDRAGPVRAAFLADNTRDQHITIPTEVVEARDPAGVGTQVVQAIGRYIRRVPPAQT